MREEPGARIQEPGGAWQHESSSYSSFSEVGTTSTRMITIERASPLLAPGFWLLAPLFSRRRRPFQRTIQLLHRSFANQTQNVDKLSRQKLDTPRNSVFAPNC